MRPAFVRRAILACFFMSGCAGLVYEVVWTRLVTLIFGGTIYAVSTVLASFMGGLALGSYVFARLVDRPGTRPLRLYAWLEIGVGAYCLAIPAVLAALSAAADAAYRLYFADASLTFALVRFLLTFAVLVIPTSLMGASLPVLCRFYARRFERLGADVGDLYAINTWGAVLGALAAGFVLLPHLGLHATIHWAVAVNFVVATCILILARGEAPSAAASLETPASARERDFAVGSPAAGLPSRLVVLVLTAFCLSGFMSLAYEVAWTRVLSLVIGMTAYAFTTMLTAFLIGLSLGSIVFARLVDRWARHLLAVFAALEVAAALIALVLSMLFERLPFIFLNWFPFIQASFERYEIAMLGMSCLVLLPQAFCFGATFPVVSRLVARPEGSVARLVGNVYALNTLGCIFGCSLAGFFLIPTLGFQTTVLVNALLGLAVGVALLAVSAIPLRGRVLAIGAVAGCALGMCLRTPPWDQVLLSSGIYTKPYLVREYGGQRYIDEVSQSRLIYYREGATENVGVFERELNLPGQVAGKYRALRINGMVEATTILHDMMTQITLGQVPMLLARDPKRVLIVGLGAGVTSSGVADYPIQEGVICELEDAVLGASEKFADINHRPWARPNFRLYVNDGRSFVIGERRPYDVITEDPVHPYSRGVSTIYSVEHYRNCRRILSPHGVMCQWLPLYDMSPEDVRTIIASFAEAFPHVTYWCHHIPGVTKADSLLIGSPQPLTVDLGRLSRALQIPSVHDQLASIGLDTPAAFLSGFMAGEEQIHAYSRGAALNTDDMPTIEYTSPRGLFYATSQSWKANFAAVDAMSGDALPPLVGLPSDRTLQAQVYVDLARAFEFRRRPLKAQAAWRKAVQLNPGVALGSHS